jgi:hypothetical protein
MVNTRRANESAAKWNDPFEVKNKKTFYLMTQLDRQTVSLLRIDKACFYGVYDESTLTVDPKIIRTGRESVESLHEDHLLQPTLRTT